LSQLADTLKKVFGTEDVRIKKFVLPGGKIYEGEELKKLMEADDASNRK